MHFYESSIITTKDGLHCQVYGNEHPVGSVIFKPKYIPTDLVECEGLPYRFISSKKMNRLNLWADKEKLKEYFQKFKLAYPDYILKSNIYDNERLLFSVPIDKIERIYFPRRGLKELMSMPVESLDKHLKQAYDFVRLLLESGLRLKDFGVTYSTLMGHYLSDISDINIVVYGKQNFWKVMKFLETAEHPNLCWKNDEDWLNFRKGHNRRNIFSEKEFLYVMGRKRSEGFFCGKLFVIFAAEKEEEVWFKWGKEKYSALSNEVVTVEGTVKENYSSVVRPGCYEIENSLIVSGFPENLPVKKVVFYSRDYAMLAMKREKIRACGILEKVEHQGDGKDTYYRIVVGYFDSYVNERRGKEYIKVLLS